MQKFVLTSIFLTIAHIPMAQAVPLGFGDVPPQPVSASSGVTVSSSFVIAGGGVLPLGLEARDGPPILNTTRQSNLDAPDATAFDDVDTTIAGIEATDPSIFFGINNDTRNGGSEGGTAVHNHQLYQIREIDEDTTSDVSERGVWGESTAQIALTSGLYDTDATGGVVNERVFTFRNERATPFTFGIEGEMDMSIFATADGMDATASATATLDMWFRSDNPLAIQFAATSVFDPVTDAMTLGSVASILRETDVAGTGHLSMTGSVLTESPDFGVSEMAFAAGSFSYALGITLQPGETISMSHLVSYSSDAAFALPEPLAAVPVPSGLPLLASAMVWMGWVRSRRLQG